MNLVRESLYEIQSFKREGTPFEKIGIGKEVLKKQILKEIGFKEDQNIKKNTEDGLKLEKLLYLWNHGNPIEKSILKDILEEISNVRINPNKYINWNDQFLAILDKSGFLWNKNSAWINFSSFRGLQIINDKKLWQEIKKWKPNKIFSLSLQVSEFELMKYAIKKGATNLNISSNKAINRAAEEGNVELVKLLLKSPLIDPSENTEHGKRYENNEYNWPIRQAAKRGHYDIVKLLIQDERVDPSAKYNFALNWALINGHLDIVDLLLTVPIVQQNIPFMPKIARKRLEKIKKINNK